MSDEGAIELIREHLELALIRAARHDWTELEDAIADLLDRLDGWCSPHRRLNAPETVAPRRERSTVGEGPTT